MSFLRKLLTLFSKKVVIVDKSVYITELIQLITGINTLWVKESYSKIPCIGFDIIESTHKLSIIREKMRTVTTIEPIYVEMRSVLDYMTHNNTICNLEVELSKWCEVAKDIIRMMPDTPLPHEEVIYNNIQTCIRHHVQCFQVVLSRTVKPVV